MTDRCSPAIQAAWDTLVLANQLRRQATRSFETALASAPVTAWPICVLQLPARLARALQGHTVGDIANMTASDVLALPGVKPRDIYEIEAAFMDFEDHGLSFRHEPEKVDA